MFPPRIVEELIRYLAQINAKSELVKREEKYEFED